MSCPMRECAGPYRNEGKTCQLRCEGTVKRTTDDQNPPEDRETDILTRSPPYNGTEPSRLLTKTVRRWLTIKRGGRELFRESAVGRGASGVPGTVLIPKTLPIRHTGLRYVAPVSVIVALCAAAERHRPYRSTVVRPPLAPLFQLAMFGVSGRGRPFTWAARVSQGPPKVWGAAGKKQRSHIEGRSRFRYPPPSDR